MSEVPIPGAVWLLGSGLIGLVGIRRKLKNNLSAIKELDEGEVRNDLAFFGDNSN